MQFGALEIAQPLVDFVGDEALSLTGVDGAELWHALEAIIAELGPRNAALLARREELQDQIDDWHRANREAGRAHDHDAYVAYLRDIGYLPENPADPVAIDTANVDEEIALVAGPQLVVPLDNARYALNAANARWGSLYDALYGTDAIDETDGKSRAGAYNATRGDAVVAWCRAFLDRHVPIDGLSHRDAEAYAVVDRALVVADGSGKEHRLVSAEQFAGYTGSAGSPRSILLGKHGLHIEVAFDRTHPIGVGDRAGVSDVRLESAITTIMDCEDSVSAVSQEDKVGVYRSWLGLMKGNLTATFVRDGESVDRALAPDLWYRTPDGTSTLHTGRSLMLVRNVGPHLRTDLVTHEGEPVYETFIDALMTSMCAMHDLQGRAAIDGTAIRNSRAGSIYIVKPKMHGADEVALACDLFSRVEDTLDLAPNTLKMGIMDEERRTSLELAAAIGHARHRVVFINTGFLDRTGDEIHTDMEAGPVLPKGEMKSATWLQAYENANVDAGLASGFRGRAQIGKGMWAMPSEMAAMLETKGQHPEAGASTAWVPSPTAATLHATHYFEVDVAARQDAVAARAPGTLEDVVALPVIAADRELAPDEIQRELDNNIQGILGYIVRWVGQGVGCSTVPDINDVGLMEDLATLRISSQHVANWLHHGLIDEMQVRDTMTRIARLVDEQNAGDGAYQPMTPDPDTSIPFRAAVDLVFSARTEPNGYTERVLREHRRAQQAQLA